MRICAIVQAYNEERFIANCLENLIRQGLSVFVIDNESTDRTVDIARRYLGRGVIGMETLKRSGTHALAAQLERKQRVAGSLDADWFLHADADEIHLPAEPFHSLLDATMQADAQGFNVINFDEFVFLPVREHPDHDHPRYLDTMHWYYFFEPRPLRLQRMWKRLLVPPDIRQSGGHVVEFEGKRIHPLPFRLKHYMVLGHRHLEQKYGDRTYDPDGLRRGWHGWRARLDLSRVEFPRARALKSVAIHGQYDKSEVWTTHHLERFQRAGA